MEFVLKRTRKKPIVGFSLDTFKTYNKYLYTDTGEAGSWNVGIWIAVEDGKPAPDKITVKIEKVETVVKK